MVNDQHLKPVVTYDIDPGLIEFTNLIDPIYYDQWMGPYLAEHIRLSAYWGANPIFLGEFESFVFYFLFFIKVCLCVLGVILQMVFGFSGW